MADVWNPPPTWPPPPSGDWRPEPGWRPDPAWPPAPAGWAFWLPADASTPHEQAKALPPAIPAPRPGFWARRKLRQAEAREAKAKAAAEAAALQARQARLALRTSVEDQIDFIAGWPENRAMDGSGLVRHRGEHVVASVAQAGIVEVKRQQGHYVAGSTGVSFRVAKGVRIRTGGMRGHYVPGDETETQIDTGSAVITNQRIVFTGARQNREWKFDNLMGRQLVHNKQLAWVELPVSNRQKTSALSFPRALADRVGSAIELALVFHAEGQADLLVSLRDQLAELQD